MNKIIFTLALFMTGELLSIPFAPLLALPLIPLIKPLTARRPAECVLSVIFIPAAALTAISASHRLAAFVSGKTLPQTPVWILASVVAAIALFCAMGGVESVTKWSGFTLPLVIGFVMLSAILLAGKLQSSGAFIPRIWERSLIIIICEAITLLAIMPALCYKEKPFRAYLAALAVACGIGAAVWALGNYTLGDTLAGRVDYPFHTALRVAKGGELIGRIEGFLTPVLLSVTVLKLAACFAVIIHGVNVYRSPSSAAASKTRFPSAVPEA